MTLPFSENNINKNHKPTRVSSKDIISELENRIGFSYTDSVPSVISTLSDEKLLALYAKVLERIIQNTSQHLAGDDFDRYAQKILLYLIRLTFNQDISPVLSAYRFYSQLKLNQEAFLVLTNETGYCDFLFKALFLLEVACHVITMYKGNNIQKILMQGIFNPDIFNELSERWDLPVSWSPDHLELLTKHFSNVSISNISNIFNDKAFINTLSELLNSGIAFLENLSKQTYHFKMPIQNKLNSAINVHKTAPIFNKMIDVDQDCYQIISAPKPIGTTGMGPCIGIFITGHASSKKEYRAASHTPSGVVHSYNTMKKYLDKKNCQSLVTHIAGGDTSTMVDILQLIPHIDTPIGSIQVCRAGERGTTKAVIDSHGKLNYAVVRHEIMILLDAEQEAKPSKLISPSISATLFSNASMLNLHPTPVPQQPSSKTNYTK